MLTFFALLEEANLLPGAPVAIETLEKRLSAGRDVEDNSFGPELPPSMKGTDFQQMQKLHT